MLGLYAGAGAGPWVGKGVTSARDVANLQRTTEVNTPIGSGYIGYNADSKDNSIWGILLGPGAIGGVADYQSTWNSYGTIARYRRERPSSSSRKQPTGPCY